MTYGLAQTVAPAELPISRDNAKLQCRVEFDDEDDLIDGAIAGATQQFEEATYRQLVTASYLLRLDSFGREAFILLPRAPLQAVSSVTYDDANGDEQTLVEDTDYIVETDREPGRIRLIRATWPAVANTPNAVRIAFDAGYGAAADVPPLILAGLRLMIGHLYEQREDTITGTIVASLPNGAKSIICMFDLGDEFEQYGSQ